MSAWRMIDLDDLKRLRRRFEIAHPLDEWPPDDDRPFLNKIDALITGRR